MYTKNFLKHTQQPISKEIAIFFAESSCLLKNGMPVLAQGSPLSPFLSNIVFIDLDKQLNSLAKANGLVYTRYADDMTFSSSRKEISTEFINVISNILRPYNYYLNETKTRIQRCDDRQMVTGLLVNEKVNVKRKYIKDIRNILYIWEKYGYVKATHRFQFAHASTNGIYKPKMETCLRGKLAYLKLIKGEDDPQFLRFSEKLKKLTNALYSQNPEYKGKGLAFGSFDDANKFFEFYEAFSDICKSEHKDDKGNHYYCIGDYEKLLISPKLFSVLKQIKPAQKGYLEREYISIVKSARVTMLKQDQEYKWILWAPPYELKKMVWTAEQVYRKLGMAKYNHGNMEEAALILERAIKLGNTMFYEAYLNACNICGRTPIRIDK